MPKAKIKARSSASGDAACGCVAGQAGDIVRGHGSRRKAAGVDAVMKEANLKHLRRIEGQVRGIAAMIMDDRYCADIITQVAAVRESLQAVSKNLLRNHLKHCAAATVAGGESNGMYDELVDLVGKIAR